MISNIEVHEALDQADRPKLGTEPNPWKNQIVQLNLKSGNLIYDGKFRTGTFKAEIVGVDRHGIFLKGGTFITFSNINSISPMEVVAE